MVITKSKYIIGLQCPLWFWAIYNHSQELLDVDINTQSSFDEGILIGNLAKKLYPKGNDLDHLDFKKQIDRTKLLTQSKKTIFEAAFLHQDLYARADVLYYDGGYNIVEVKSSTKVKNIHIEDLAFQKYVYKKSGLAINKSYILTINSDYIKDGEINPNFFFTKTDVTEEVDKINIEKNLERLRDFIKNKPNISITECESEYECPIHTKQLKELPKGNVFELYRGGKLSRDLYYQGIIQLEDILDLDLTEKQKIQVDCAKNNKCKIQTEKIKDFLKQLKFPIYYLDFETFNPAIPLYDGMKPYQKIPFQFSLHVGDKHYEFLHKEKTDPRPYFLKALKEYIGKAGSIITYNQSFELNVIKELVKAYSEYKDLEENIKERVVDLLLPFRNFYYYNPKQRGSASIKRVLPAITKYSYKDLEIAQGSDASVLYRKAIYENIENKEEIFKNLLEYCKLDTKGMIYIIDELKKI